MQLTAEVKTLLDSGAMENLMDSRTANALCVKKQELLSPRKVTNADGSQNAAGMLTHYCELRVRQGDKEQVQTFFITNLGMDRVILGYPWFRDFNPQIDWAKRILHGPQLRLEAKWYERMRRKQQSLTIRWVVASPEYEEGDEVIIVSRANIAQQWAQEAQKQQKEERKLPPQYQRWEHVFSEERAKRFPPSRPEDHAIKLKPGAPDVIDCKIFPLTRIEKEATEKWIRDNEEKGYIERSNSPWSTPWFFVKKKSGELRPVQDYREVNSWTVRDVYPMLHIEQIMEDLAGKELFSKLDVRSGYHNVRIKEEDQWKAAFKTHLGLFHPNVMLFGLTNSPATFQRLTDRTLKPVKDKYGSDVCHGYMDDYLVATHNDPVFHREVMNFLLEQVAKQDLYLKLSKCEFEQTEVEYLGVAIKDGTIRIDPTKRNGLKTWPRQLSTVKEVRSTLGVLGFQRQFIPHFAHITKPLTTLLKKDQPFKWTQKCTNALDRLIEIVTSDPILHRPDHSKQFELEVDTSQYAVGAILYQRDSEGRQRPVAYHSETLDETQRGWEIYDRELYAIVAGLENWCHLLLGAEHEVLVYTDHANLQYYRHPHKINRRVARYIP
jgi:RNase H-like domain found in reverse transcriptase/Reverse transcriptase (RNA-dependent DNA polymerase)/gag-polyprotein putative aspartyl protease